MESLFGALVWLYMMEIIFGNTPFSLSFALLSRRSKAVYTDGHCFPLGISSFESTLYQRP
jgi:hypothetical protein